jgi:hypothetical protein
MYETFLLSVPILASLEGYERAKIADALESRTYQSGELVIQEGESGDDFYIIESGSALVEKSDAGVIGELKRGDYFGGKRLYYFRPELVYGSRNMATPAILHNRTSPSQSRTSSRDCQGGRSIWGKVACCCTWREGFYEVTGSCQRNHGSEGWRNVRDCRSISFVIALYT